MSGTNKKSIVRKANDLIQKSRFELSMQQQKVILYLISQIKPTDTAFNLYEFKIADFCRVCGIDDDSGKTYADLKAAIKSIADKSVWITRADGQETLVRWIEKPFINKKSGIIKIKLDADMMPFLLQLKKNYTSYNLFWTMKFKSKYAIRLYEYLQSVHYNKQTTYTQIVGLNDLKRIMGAETYKTWNNFKVRALLPAVNDINSYSDKSVTVEELKTGRAITAVKFILYSKPTEEKELLLAGLE